jgi:hypothetical protein
MFKVKFFNEKGKSVPYYHNNVSNSTDGNNDESLLYIYSNNILSPSDFFKYYAVNKKKLCFENKLIKLLFKA